MTILWILGALVLCFPDLLVNVLLMAFFLINGTTVSKELSSCFFFKLNNFLILLALFGPNLLGFETSVSPGISLAPLWVMVKKIALMSFPTMHPLTVFLFISPVLLGL